MKSVFRDFVFPKTKPFCWFLLLATVTASVQSQSLKSNTNSEDLKIAFVSYRTGSAEIFLMDKNGEEVNQITNSKESNSFPFQVDKRTLGFTRTDSLRNQIKMKIDIYTGEEQPYVDSSPRPGAKWAQPSPDSKLWAFVRETDYSDRELFIYNQISAEEKQITSQADSLFRAYSINHVWAPDNKTLAFMSGPDWYTQNIRLYNIADGTLRTLTEIGYMNSGLKWLNKETLIANLKVRDKTKYELFSIAVADGKMIPLTKGINLHPDVSPDGEWIVFESQRHGDDGEVYIMKSDGSSQTRLTTNNTYDGRCIWFSLQ